MTRPHSTIVAGSLALLLATFCPSAGAGAGRESFISAAGTVKAGEHTLVLTLDGQVILPGLMLGYRHGVSDWLELGLDVGGSVGLFQTFAQVKLALYRPASDGIFIGARIYSGYKTHHYEIGSIIADDTSWGTAIEPSISLRFGEHKRRALYYSVVFYVDVDLHSPRRQTDLYLLPAIVGFESRIGHRFSFYVEGGLAISINGTETNTGVLYLGALFPVLKAGLAFRLP